MKADAGELTFFVVLARLGKLSATARELAVTPPAVTKRLALLEQRLGVRLVNRTTRRVSLTSEGETYLAHATCILAEIGEMEDLVSSSRATPRGLLKHGEPQTLAELAAHRVIIHRQNDDAYGIWRFTRNRKSEMVKVHGKLSSNDGDIALGWALDGQGLLIRSEWDLAKYFDSGRLQLVLPAYTLPPADFFVYYASQSNLPARVRTFIDFLVARIGPAPALAPRRKAV